MEWLLGLCEQVTDPQSVAESGADGDYVDDYDDDHDEREQDIFVWTGF